MYREALIAIADDIVKNVAPKKLAAVVVANET